VGVSESLITEHSSVETVPEKRHEKLHGVAKWALVAAVPAAVFFGTTALIEIDAKSKQRSMELVMSNYEVNDVRLGPTAPRTLNTTFIVTVKDKEYKCSRPSDETLEKREAFMCDDFEMIFPVKPV
jgi:hypothetical protein